MKRPLWLPALATGFAVVGLVLLPGCLDETAFAPGPLPVERLTPEGSASFSGLTDAVASWPRS